MTDEYQKLYASLSVLGKAIEKVEAHLAKHPARLEVFVDVTDEYWRINPDGHYDDDGLIVENDGHHPVTLRMSNNVADYVDDLLICFEGEDGNVEEWRRLSDASSTEKTAFAKYLPELIRIADLKVLELAKQAEDYAGEIEQALAAAAKKPTRKAKS